MKITVLIGKSCVSNKSKGFLGRMREDKFSASQYFDAKFCRGSARRPPPNTNWRSCSFVISAKLCRPYNLKLEYIHSYQHPQHGVLDLHAVMEFPMQRSWPAAHETRMTHHCKSTLLFPYQTLHLWARAVPNVQYLTGLLCKLIRHALYKVFSRKILMGWHLKFSGDTHHVFPSSDNKLGRSL